MNRRQKVVALARLIDAGRAEAAGGRLGRKKEKQEAEERESDIDTLKPDEYRKKHDRCPPGYQYDVLTDTCESSDPEPAEPEEDQTQDEQQEEKREADERPADEKKDEKPGERKKETRKERGGRLRKLFDDDFGAYQKEVARMRETGELPDRETSKLLVKVKNVDDLPEEVLRDKKKLQEIVEQQDAQRQHEEMLLKRTEDKLQDLERQRGIAEKAGRKPPKLDVVKLLQDIEEQYGRPLDLRSEKTDRILREQDDKLLQSFGDSAPNPGEPSYWMKKFFERLTKPIPRWTPGRTKAAVEESRMDVVSWLDAIADELDGRGADASAVDAAADVLAATSPGVTDLQPTEIGFPPYDKQRPPRRHTPDQPSGRRAFPPYDVFVPYKDTARDASMKGFPPYDGKGGPLDSETIGLPPYNGKQPHVSRGFPPFSERKSVYEEREKAVEEAVR